MGEEVAVEAVAKAIRHLGPRQLREGLAIKEDAVGCRIAGCAHGHDNAVVLLGCAWTRDELGFPSHASCSLVDPHLAAALLLVVLHKRIGNVGGPDRRNAIRVAVGAAMVLVVYGGELEVVA